MLELTLKPTVLMHFHGIMPQVISEVALEAEKGVKVALPLSIFFLHNRKQNYAGV